jgi:hypothetical protein
VAIGYVQKECRSQDPLTAPFPLCAHGMHTITTRPLIPTWPRSKPSLPRRRNRRSISIFFGFWYISFPASYSTLFNGPSEREGPDMYRLHQWSGWRRHYKLRQYFHPEPFHWRCGRMSTCILRHGMHAPPTTSVAHAHHFPHRRRPPTL